MSDRFTAPRFLAGLQAGMSGALIMLVWLALTSVWSRHSIWWFPNLIATTFGGDSALQSRFDKFTPSGLALHLVLYSLLGGFFAMILPERAESTRVLLFSTVLSLGFYYFMYDFVWKHMNSLIVLYSPDRPVVVGHILYGFALARLPRFLNRASRNLSGASQEAAK